jgi:hypothetical protein
MKKLLLLLLPLSSFAQYFQQDVSYQIEVKLDDKKHEITGFETLVYKNNSSQTLEVLYMHVWPNAYKNSETALAKQLKRTENDKIGLAKPEDLGSINELDFKIDGQSVKWEFTPEHQDIVLIHLPKGLTPGASLTLTTPFKVKIPSGSISRLGHIGQSYQITQWYPKPAVFDQNGWNQMPYLNQGEFYSEYGNFDVQITVPSNYVVGATGELQTEAEIAFLDDKVKQSAKKLENLLANDDNKKASNFPESATTWKTIRYTQDRVHDFAWFADKRFLVLKGEVTLPHSKETVTTWAMFTPQNAKLWANSLEYLHDGTYYYSLWNGDYPYKHVTAIDGTISAGGGMEYPMITVIGNASSKEELEVVIVHEVGHNWFYGILGSNERVHGWMDEGLNTLNEMRYVQTKYPDNTRFSDMVAGGRFHLNDLDHHDSGDIMYRSLASFGLDQPLEIHSDDFSSMNYGAIMYQKTGVIFFYLMDYLGAEKFDAAMSAYYQQWKFKHPQPADLKKSLETTTGKDLNWLFDDLIQTTRHIDYKIASVKPTLKTGSTIKLKNKGQVNGPIEVNVYGEKGLLETRWAEPGATELYVQTPYAEINKVEIDRNNDIPELNRQNNLWVKDQLFKKVEPLRFEFLFGDHEKSSSTIFWTPMIGGNAYDGFMAGLTVHNIGLAPKKFTYLVSPMLSTSRLRPVGMAEFSYQILPTKAFELIRIGTSVKSFGTDKIYNNSYFAVSPYLHFNLGSRTVRHPLHQEILVQGLLRSNNNETSIGNQEQGFFAQYLMNYKKPAYLLSWTSRYEFFKSGQSSITEQSISRIWTNMNQTFNYRLGKFDRKIELNLFGGYTLSFTDNAVIPSDRMFWSINGLQGEQDLFLEDYNLGRSETSGFWSQQRMDRHGQFHTANSAGSNINWLTTASVYAQLPIKPNIFGVFADFGLAPTSGINESAIDHFYNAGLAIRMGKVFGVYFPLVYGNSYYTGQLFTNYAQNIRFSLRINIVNRLSLHTLLNS